MKTFFAICVALYSSTLFAADPATTSSKSTVTYARAECGQCGVCGGKVWVIEKRVPYVGPNKQRRVKGDRVCAKCGNRNGFDQACPKR
jgi:hypothetical protein